MWNSSSQVWFSDPWSPQGQNYFHNNAKKVMCLPIRAETQTDSGKAMAGQGPLAPIKAVVPCYIEVILHHQKLAVKKSQFTLRMSFKKQSQSFLLHLVPWYTTCDRQEVPLKHSPCTPGTLLISRKAPVQMFHLGGKLVFFLWNTKFSLKNWQTTAIQTEEDIFLKMNKVSLSLQGNLLLFRISEKLPPAILSWGVISDSSAEPREQLVRDEAKRKKNR